MLLGLSIAAFVVYAYAYDPLNNEWAPKCIFKQLTGWDCPGCGMQRAAHALLHGDFRAAFGYNAFLLIAIPYVIAIFIADYLLRGELRQRVERIVRHPYAIMAYLLLTIAWFVLRNIYHW